MIQAEVPDRGNPSSDEVRNQIVESGLMQGDERQPVDEQPSGIDRPVQHCAMQDAALPAVMPRPPLIQDERHDH